MSGESVLKKATESVEHCTDPMTKFPIPSERDLRTDRKRSRATTSSTSTASRHINFTGEGCDVNFATDLPYQPPGLHWNEALSITTRQLQKKKEQMKKASQ